MNRVFIALILGVLVPSRAEAHPVTYKDGWALMDFYSRERNDLWLQQTFSRSMAFGMTQTAVDRDSGDVRYLYPRLNYLAWRRNQPDSQANVYVSLGAGRAERLGESEPVAFGFAEADYETRRIYSAFEVSSLQGAGSEYDASIVMARLGVAPYKAEFDELHTWIIAQARYQLDEDEIWSVGPMIRLFYGKYLVEIGVDQDGEVMATGMIHY